MRHLGLVGRRPDRHHPLAHPRGPAGRELELRQPDLGHAQQGDVVDRVEPGKLGLGPQAVRGSHPEALGADHHARGRDDDELLHRHARADASPEPLADLAPPPDAVDRVLGIDGDHRGVRRAGDLIHVGLERRQRALARGAGREDQDGSQRRKQGQGHGPESAPLTGHPLSPRR